MVFQVLGNLQYLPMSMTCWHINIQKIRFSTSFARKELIKVPLLQELRDSDIFIVLDGLDELETTSSSSTHDAIYNRKLDIEVLLAHLMSTCLAPRYSSPVDQPLS